MQKLIIDINCDLGEGMESDALLMPFISSANIACGYHAGDADTMRKTVVLCMENNVAIGAHPSFYDRTNFGRTDMTNTAYQPKEIPALITEQLELLQNICKESGTRMHHVKPHGALYNRAAWDETVAGFIAGAVSAFDKRLVFYGLSGSKMETAAAAHGLVFASEVFADRSYQDDGSLTPRTMPYAVIEEDEKVLSQVLEMVQQQQVATLSGKIISIKADTICIHGDGLHAAQFAATIYQYLKNSNIDIQTIR